MKSVMKSNPVSKLFQFYLDLKIIWKMIIGFGLILMAGILIVGVSQSTVNHLNNNVNSLIDNELVPLVHLQDIRSNIREMEVTVKDALLNNDQVALNYIRVQYLPNNVKVMVDYSFKQLITQAAQIKNAMRKNIAKTTKSDWRMANETVTVLKELQANWVDYYNLYQQILVDTSIAKNPEFVKEEKRLRFFLVGGMDRLDETYYRQQAMIAKAESEESFKQHQILTGILLLLSILLVIGVSIITAWVIITPLTRMANASRKIASGELKISVPENRNDELGEVAQCFNLMTSELTFLVDKIKVAADNVHENSRRLLDGTHNATAVTQQLVDTLSQVAEGADRQQQRVSSIHNAIQTITDFSQVVNHVTHRVEELSTDSVVKALQGETVANEAVEKMKSVQKFMDTSTETMNRLHVLSGEIEGMMMTVKEIGEQINLLSLNASIEAARAGESGRGFSVVAESIGELAVRTKKATSQVQDLVSRIQTAFKKLTEMLQTENVVMSEGKEAVASLYELFEGIIVSAKQVNQELGEVTQYTLKLTEEHTEVLRAVEHITDIAMQHKTGTEQASSAAEEHYSYTQEIISSSQILAHWGDNLHQAVNRFKITHDQKNEPIIP